MLSVGFLFIDPIYPRYMNWQAWVKSEDPDQTLWNSEVFVTATGSKTDARILGQADMLTLIQQTTNWWYVFY